MRVARDSSPPDSKIPRNSSQIIRLHHPIRRFDRIDSVDMAEQRQRRGDIIKQNGEADSTNLLR